MDMNILKYQAFIKTVETGSFTKAGLQLNYSQSGISRMISDLEQEWHVTLLERSRNGVKLTSDGQLLLPRAKALCAEYERLQSQVQELHGLESGLLRIGVFPSVVTHWIPNIIKKFQEDFPGIEYELRLGGYREIESWIRDGSVDCGFLAFLLDKTLDFISLERDRFLAILPEDHPLAQHEKVSLQDLCKEDFLLMQQGSNTEISDLLSRNGVSPNVRMTLYEDYAVMAMVESGLGVSILPELILKRTPYRFVARELDVPAYREIGLAIRSRETASIATKWFMNYLQYR